MKVNFFCALFSNFFCAVVVHPLWFVKNRIEMQSYESKKAGWVQYSNWFDCVKKVGKHEKFFAFYKGLIPSLWLAPQGALQIVVYEEAKNMHLFSSLSYGEDFLRGFFSKLFVSFLCYPFQVVRSRLQLVHSPFSHVSLFRILQQIKMKEGILSLYRGYGVYMQRTCLHSGILFFLYEKLNK